ncbi:CPA_1a_G0057320.mRNA.1.CDS.1 [Saccharomyces cerevisiae]|nr:CPA_1a_G0057320.mRNA.1.CDS.1 [Saccharomyces cerevisiae]CAI4836957.1 CPI_1c_G0056380.mRNA.1.CDS.1 [Saccharomyces cerevisiae]CAI7487061.1 CPI_1c_G0056380.mRNA.1.CDS.1 [Saccharomyces cerevisiae]CAI7489834.1 CPA_1a_G0057320.mRNA.1.CDS.1 [Saccharomyces cerevisiae]
MHCVLARILLWFLIVDLSVIRALVLPPLKDYDPLEPLMKRDMAMGQRNRFKVDGQLPPILNPTDVTDDQRSLHTPGEIPSYVINHCPLVHLYSEEKYWPSDIAEYVQNFQIKDKNGNSISTHENLTLHDLKAEYHVDLFGNKTETHIPSSEVFLTSLDDFDKDPKWLLGHLPEYGTGYNSKAPAILIVVDKGNGWVDAFWFFFYPFNHGPFIMGHGPWGNHVGDWEHSLVRFYKGIPKYLWMSAHSSGTGYRYEAVEKFKKLRKRKQQDSDDGGDTILERPLIFSARGTHANYASSGQHAHDIPFFFMPLSDFTDRGPLWDPSLNFYSYTFDGKTVTPSSEREESLGLDWLHFQGGWGDQQLPARDPRQKWCVAQWKYIGGPRGPLFKKLDRLNLCGGVKKWNFWNGGCPARRLIKKAEGLDSESTDLMGDNCGVLLYRIRPKWLRGILRFLMWRGILCSLMEFFTN